MPSTPPPEYNGDNKANKENESHELRKRKTDGDDELDSIEKADGGPEREMKGGYGFDKDLSLWTRFQVRNKCESPVACSHTWVPREGVGSPPLRVRKCRPQREAKTLPKIYLGRSSPSGPFVLGRTLPPADFPPST